MFTSPLRIYVNMSLNNAANLPHDIFGHLIVMRALAKSTGAFVCVCAAMPTSRVQERFLPQFLQVHSCGWLALASFGLSGLISVGAVLARAAASQGES